jgi:hypothetical protein
MPVALQLVVYLCYLIPLHDPPLLALQIGPEKNFGRAVGHGHRVDSRQGLYLAAPARWKRQGHVDVRCRESGCIGCFFFAANARA